MEKPPDPDPGHPGDWIGFDPDRHPNRSKFPDVCRTYGDNIGRFMAHLQDLCEISVEKVSLGGKSEDPYHL
jgi:hypothetical protein